MSVTARRAIRQPRGKWYYPLRNSATDPTDTWWRSNRAPLGYEFRPNDGIYANESLKNMEYMFNGNSTFNDPDISLWDVSKVTDMTEALSWCPAFNQDLSNWNTSNVTTMYRMFTESNSFNQDLSNWDVSKVTNFEEMFYDNLGFNNGGQPLNWTRDGLVTSSMNYMFYGCASLNVPLNLNLRNVPNIYQMMGTCTSFNQDVSNWDVSDCLDMGYLFYGCTAFNNGGQPLKWTRDGSTTAIFQGMFSVTENFNADLSEMNVSNVNDFRNMFQLANAFNNNSIMYWDVEDATQMQSMFWNAASFNQQLGSWSTPNITGEPSLFRAGSPLSDTNMPLFNGKQVGLVFDVNTGYSDSTPIGSFQFKASVGATSTLHVDWGDGSAEETFTNISFTNLRHDYASAYAEYTISVRVSGDMESLISLGSAFDPDKVTRIRGLNTKHYFPHNSFYSESLCSRLGFDWPVDYSGLLGPIKWPQNTTLEYMFQQNKDFNEDLSKWDVTNVTSFFAFQQFNAAYNNGGQPLTWTRNPGLTGVSAEAIFEGCSILNVPMNWDTSGISSFYEFFASCNLFDQDTNWINASSATTMEYMFYDCNAFNNGGQPIAFTRDGSTPCSMAGLFYTFSNTFNPDISALDTTNVTSFYDMFGYCYVFDQNINHFNWDKVEEVRYMFDEGAFNNGGQPLVISRDGSTSLSLRNMFSYTYNFNQPITLTNWSNISSYYGMFQSAYAFNQNINSWDLSYSSDFQALFQNASVFNNGGVPLNINRGATLANTNFFRMFANDCGYNQTLDNLDLTNVTVLNGMFYQNANFNQNLNGLDVSSVGDFQYMFYQTGAFNNGGVALNWTRNASTPSNMYYFLGSAVAFNVPINFSMANVNNLSRFLYHADAFDQDISNWDVSDCTNFNEFAAYSVWNNGGQPLTWTRNKGTPCTMAKFLQYNDVFNQPLVNFVDTAVTDISYFLYGPSMPFNQSLDSWDVSGVTNFDGFMQVNNNFTNAGSPLAWTRSAVSSPATMRYFFKQNSGYVTTHSLATFNLTNVTNISYMFANATNGLTVANPGSMDTSDVQIFEYVFQSAPATFNLDMSGWDLSKATSIKQVFGASSSFNNGGQPLNWTRDGSTTLSMREAFYNLDGFNQPINLNTSNVNDFYRCFYSCNLFNQSLNSWDFSQATDTSDMFYSSLQFDNGGVPFNPTRDGSTALNAYRMFANCRFNQPINWSWANVTSVQQLFSPNNYFDQNINSWDLSDVQTFYGMFQSNNTFNNGGNPLSFTRDGTTQSTFAYMFNNSNFNQPVSLNFTNVTNVDRMFYNVTERTASVLPSTGNMQDILSFEYMFYGCPNFNQDLSSWDVSGATEFQYMFYNCLAFNNGGQPFAWTRNLTATDPANFQSMFQGCDTFNVPITADFGYGRYYTNMFRNTDNFNQDVSGWDVTDALSMIGMFQNAIAFNNGGNALTWTRTNPSLLAVDGLQLDYMFAGCPFNQPINMNFINTTSCSFMFNSSAFNQNINAWDLSYVDDASYMFYLSSAFDNGGVAPTWNLGQNNHYDGCTMTYMFREAAAFNQDISGINYNKISSIHRIFYLNTVFQNGGLPLTINRDGSTIITANNAFQQSSFNQPFSMDLNGYADVTYLFAYAQSFNSSVTFSNQQFLDDVSYMFFFAPLFNQSINSFDLSNCITARNMFNGAAAFNNGGVAFAPTRIGSTACDMSSMFSGASNFNVDVSGFNTAGVTNMNSMFSYASLFNQPLTGWDTSSVTSMAYFLEGTAFNDPSANNLNVSNVTNLEGAFADSLFNQSLSNWDTSKVTNFSNMFLNASNFNGSVANWNVLAATNLAGMFDSSNFNQDISSWGSFAPGTTLELAFNFTPFNQNINALDLSNVANLRYAFAYSGFKNGGVPFNPTRDGTTQLNMEGAFTYSIMDQRIDMNLSNVANMSEMLAGCTTYNAPVSHWDVSSVTTMNSLFWAATSFNQPITNWNTPALTNTYSMFRETSFNQPVAMLNMSNVTDMGGMFKGCSTFNQDVSGWNTSSATDMWNMFEGCSAFNCGESAGVEHSLMDRTEWTGWQVASVANMFAMFQNCLAFNGNLGNWNVSGSPLNTNFDANTPAWTTGVRPVWGTGSIANKPDYWAQEVSVSNGQQIDLNITNPVGLTIDWGDGTTTTGIGTSGLTSHTYATAGNYVIQATLGTALQAFVTDLTAVTKIYSAGNGDVITSGRYWLRQNNALTYVPRRIPPTWTDFTGTFYFNSCSDLGVREQVGKWNTGHVQDFTNAMLGSSINPYVDEWDMSGARYLDNMFDSATCNRNLDSWDVSNVETASQMFSSGTMSGTMNNLNWAKCSTLKGMFQNATFNQSVTNWSFGGTNVVLWNLFLNNSGFNQPLSSWTGLENVQDMDYMFNGCTNFNQDISGWNVSNVIYITSMFENASSYNQDLSGLYFSSVTSQPADFSTGASSWVLAKPQVNISGVPTTITT